MIIKPDRCLLTLRAVMLLFSMAALALSTAASEKVKVACVGNSITYGVGTNPRDSLSYPAQLQRLLGSGFEVENFGHPGATLLTSGHNPYVKLPEFRQALAFRPDIVVIHLGVNDTDPRNWPNYGDKFVENYIALIDSFKLIRPDARIIISRVTPIGAKHRRFKSGTRDWRILVNEAIDRIAQASGAELIDFNAALRDWQHTMKDAVHPDAVGAGLMAEAARGAITGDFGGLHLPEVYYDNMVLQRYKPIRILGKADAGGRISATLGGLSAHAVADNQGNFTLVLPPMPEAVRLTLTVSDGKSTKHFKNVAIGEVWIASGQSNMAFPGRSASTFLQDSVLHKDPLLRLFDMQPRVQTDSREWSEADKDSVDNLRYYLPSRWVPSTPEAARDFSAVAWYFGKTLRDSLDVPVGIISNAIGGAGTCAWVDVETLEPDMPEILVDWRHNDYVQPWVQQRALQNTGNSNLSRRHPYEPSYLFAAGIRPLGAYPLAGVLWYQGESNAHNIELHERLFRSLIDSWRNNWKEPEMPFVFAQLSSIDRPSWPAFRDSQRRLADELPQVYMAVTSDVGDSLDVHPRDKRTVADRLARQALRNVYSMMSVAADGPQPATLEYVAPGTLLLTLKNAEGLHSADSSELRTFEIAETDGLFLPAKAEIIAPDKIKLTNMDIRNPRFARYAWQPFTRANLVNGANLPASTFVISAGDEASAETGFDSGVSAAFAGRIGERIFQAGGCNFPSNPMAPDARKKFYSGIYELLPAEEGYKPRLIGHLPVGMAYGCAVSVPEGIILIGGTDANGALRSVRLLSIGTDDRTELTELPDLPATIDNMAVCVADGKIYVAAGNVDGVPSNELFCLDLSNTPEGWRRLEPFPGNPRVQPVMAASDASGKMKLYLWGGFAGKGEGREASLNTDGYAYTPAKGKWEHLEAPKDPAGADLSTGGGAAATLPDGRILVVGGVNKDIFLEALRNQAPDYLSHPIDWYRFNSHVLMFDPAKDAWCIVESTHEAARAGAAAVALPAGDGVVVIGGELKPRIRTPKVYEVKMK